MACPFAYASDGSLLLCTEGREVLVHDGGNEAPRWRAELPAPVVGVAASGGVVTAADASGVVHRFVSASGAVAGQVATGRAFWSMATSGEALALLSTDGVVVLRPNHPQAFVPVPGAQAVALGCSGERLAVLAQGLLHLFALDGSVRRLGERPAPGATCVASEPDGAWLAGAGERIVRVSASGDGEETFVTLTDEQVEGLFVSSDGRLCAARLRGDVVVVLSRDRALVGNARYLDKKVGEVAFGPSPWLGVGLSGGDGNKINLATGAVHRTDTHPGREHHRWMLTASFDAAAVTRAQQANAPATAQTTRVTPQASSSLGRGLLLVGLSLALLVVWLLIKR